MKYAVVSLSTIILAGGCQDSISDLDSSKLTKEIKISAKDGILHFPNPEVFENHMFGLQEYKVIGEDTFYSLAAVKGDFHWEAGRRLTDVNLHGIYRGRLGGSSAGANAIPYEFRLQPIIRD